MPTTLRINLVVFAQKTQKEQSPWTGDRKKNGESVIAGKSKKPAISARLGGE